MIFYFTPNIRIDTISDITTKKESEMFKFRTVATIAEKAKKMVLSVYCNYQMFQL